MKRLKKGIFSRSLILCNFNKTNMEYNKHKIEKNNINDDMIKYKN